jgi:hypothetical protein
MERSGTPSGHRIAPPDGVDGWMNLPAQQPTPGRDELLTAFGIGPADLAANRAGRLGPVQMRRVLLGAAPGLALAIVLAVVPVFVLPFGFVFTILGVVWGAMIIRSLLAARRDGTVACLSGTVSVMLLFRQHRGFWITIEGRSFRLPIPPDLLENGAPYRVFYRRSRHRIVAMEPAADLGPRLRAVLPEAG